MGEARVKELMAKQREKLNRNVEEALAREWNEWSAQAAKLQIFRVDTKNWKTEGRGLYKMDENNIQVLREDFTDEFTPHQGDNATHWHKPTPRR